MLWAVSTSAGPPVCVWALPPNVGGTALRHVQVGPNPTLTLLANSHKHLDANSHKAHQGTWVYDGGVIM